MGVVLKKGKPVEVEVSLEQKYHYSGRVTNAEGKPQPDCYVQAIWKDPADKNSYSSNTKTNSFGRYQFSSPFPMARSIPSTTAAYIGRAMIPPDWPARAVRTVLQGLR